MERKYWVPALERANSVLDVIAKNHGKMKLMDLSDLTGINKSSLFSILRTMEELAWVRKNVEEAYELGKGMAFYNTMLNEAASNNARLVEVFDRYSSQSAREIGETFQLSILEGDEIMYLAKKEGNSFVKLESGPGMRFPAHATAMGKMMLSALEASQLEKLYPDKQLTQITPYTVISWPQFISTLNEICEQGYAVDREEIIEGIFCIAAPIHDSEGKVIAAVSTSMMQHAYRDKQDHALEILLKLAEQVTQTINS